MSNRTLLTAYMSLAILIYTAVAVLLFVVGLWGFGLLIAGCSLLVTGLLIEVRKYC